MMIKKCNQELYKHVSIRRESGKTGRILKNKAYSLKQNVFFHLKTNNSLRFLKLKA
jgi:hypothetical protein